MTPSRSRRCASLPSLLLPLFDRAHAFLAQVVLVGGSSKLPAVSDKLYNLFPESTVTTNQIEPDEVLAKGSALQIQSLRATFPSDSPNADELLRASTTEQTVVAPSALSKPLGFVLEPEAASTPENLAFVTLMDQHTPLPARRIVDLPIESDATSSVVLALWEGEPYIKVTPAQSKLDQAKSSIAGAASSILDAAKKAVGAGADDEDLSDEEEDEDIRTVEVRATKPVADLVIPVDASQKGKKVRVTIVVDKDGKGHVEARQLVDGAKSVEKDF